MPREPKEEEILGKIHALVKEWKDRQHFRKATAMRAKQYGISLPIKEFRQAESTAVKELMELVPQTKIGKKLLKLHGLGIKTIALLISFLHPIDVWDGPRSIRHYMGNIPDDAILSKPIKKHGYNHEFHAIIRWIIMLQLQHGGIYKGVYEELKDEINREHPDWKTLTKSPKSKRTKLENAAFSRTMYEFIKDIWLAWTGREGSRIDLIAKASLDSQLVK